MKAKKFVDPVARYLPLLVVIVVVYFSIQPLGGEIGHDYAHAFSRLLIGAANFWQNPFSIPFYSANLCGGIPLYPDPQSYYFSIPQFLTFFINPLLASQITILLFYLVGYAGAVWLFARVLGTSRRNAHLGALLFITNGFAFANLFVGHLTHHPYFLLPWIVGIFIQTRERFTREFWRDTAALSLMLAYCFYSGAMHMIIVFAVCLFLLLPMAYTRNRMRSQKIAWVTMVGLCVLACLVATASKLIPSILYARHFYVDTMHSTSDGLFNMVLQYFWFNPFTTPTGLPFGNLNMGAWEYVGFISRLTFIGLGGAIYWQAKQKDQKSQVRFAYYVLVAFGIVVVAWGSRFNSFLPFFRSYHNPIKLLAALILPLIVLTVWFLEERKLFPNKESSRKIPLFYALLICITLSEFVVGANYYVSQKVGISYRYVPEVYQALRANHRLTPVTKTTYLMGVDAHAVAGGYTAVGCYEPLFGYERQKFSVDVTEDPPSTIRDSAFNLTHPGCFLYPSFYGCKAWSRIPASQPETFEKFTQGDANAFALPWWQHALNYASLAGVLLLSGLGIGTAQPWRKISSSLKREDKRSR